MIATTAFWPPSSTITQTTSGSGIYPFGLESGQLEFPQIIVAEAAYHQGLSAHANHCRGGVGSFSACSHPEIAAVHIVSRPWHAGRLEGNVNCQAADYCDFGHLNYLSTPPSLLRCCRRSRELKHVLSRLH
jgi:hypothetical protein